MKKNKHKSLKYKLTCPNKKCNYMIEVGKDTTAHLHKILKKCPVCKTKYKKSDIPFHKIRLSKKQRLKVRKQILKVADYEKKRNALFRFIIFLYQKIKLFIKYIKIKFNKIWSKMCGLKKN